MCAQLLGAQTPLFRPQGAGLGHLHLISTRQGTVEVGGISFGPVDYWHQIN